MTFYIIGIDDSANASFSHRVEQIIRSNTIFSGGARHHKLVSDVLPNAAKWIDIRPPMDDLFTLYADYESIVVFASGDPLFYGFAQTVQRLMPEARIITFPNFNSLQLLAHRLIMPYQDMRVVSLTGREWHKFDEALIAGEQLIGLLTDNKEHSVTKIAERMVDYGYTNYTMHVGELLGNEQNEKVSSMSVEQASKSEFAYPNNIILALNYKRKRYFGIPDSEFELLDGREKMITKKDIRLATLSMLDLAQSETFWDVGFCTGSVSMEAKLLFPHLKINSFEIRESCASIIEKNIKHFGAVGINYHIGDFCDFDLNALPCADCVFIGGHGGKLAQIVSKIASRLNSGGCIVFNSVSSQSYDDFLSACANTNLHISQQTEISVDNFNKITIIKATKQ